MHRSNAVSLQILSPGGVLSTTGRFPLQPSTRPAARDRAPGRQTPLGGGCASRPPPSPSAPRPGRARPQRPKATARLSSASCPPPPPSLSPRAAKAPGGELQLPPAEAAPCDRRGGCAGGSGSLCWGGRGGTADCRSCPGLPAVAAQRSCAQLRRCTAVRLHGWTR